MDLNFGTFTPINLGATIRLVGLDEFDGETLLFKTSHNHPDQRLWTYNISTQETTTLFETSGTIYDVQQSSDWIAVNYTQKPAEFGPDVTNMSTHIWLSNADTTIQQPMTSMYNYLHSFGFLSPFFRSDRWFAFDAEDGVYLFDTQDATFEHIPLDTPAPTFGTFTQLWSPDERYLTLETSPTRYGSADDTIVVWDTETDTFVREFEPHTKLIGWQGSPRQQNLHDCGISLN